MPEEARERKKKLNLKRGHNAVFLPDLGGIDTWDDTKPVKSRRRNQRFDCDWSSDVCSSDLLRPLTTTRIGTRTLWSCMPLTPRPRCQFRSEERRVGKEGRSRWSPFH